MARLRRKAGLLAWVGKFGLLELSERTQDEVGAWSLDTLVPVLQQDRRVKGMIVELS